VQELVRFGHSLEAHRLRISFTRLANPREALKRSFSSSGDSPPLRIMPANSPRLM
jgi:hypothetical protein